MPKKARPGGLPDYQRPPVTEVILSVQFAALPGFRSAYIGLLWEAFRSTYPSVSEQPPVQPVFETFGAATPPSPILQIQALLSPPMFRYWFEHPEDPSELLQVQQDRIMHNWRKREAEQTYPRYEAIRKRFAHELATFVEFLNQEKLGELKPNQCEVSYINTIELPDGVNPHQCVERITPLWAGRQSTEFLPEISDVNMHARYDLREDGKPFGRVHVIFTPAFRTSDQAPVIRLEITARGKPHDESITAAFHLLDEERKVIVRKFDAVTTPSMHEFWGKKNA